MQITSIPQIGQGSGNAGYSVFQSSEQYFSASRDVSIEVSGDGDSVTLTETNTVLYYESTYTETGVLSNSTADSSGTESAGSVLSTGEAALVAQAEQDYLTLVRERIAYLLEEAEKASQANGQAVSDAESIYAGDGTVTSTESLYAVSTTESVTLSVDMDYWSAENTASRIVQFALSFYDGGDREAFVDEVRAAVMDGFNQALDAMGGTLSDESYETIELVNQALDAFAAGEDA